MITVNLFTKISVYAVCISLKKNKTCKKKYVAEHCGCGDMQQQEGMEGMEGRKGGGEVMAEEERGGWGVAGWQGGRWGAVAG